MFVRLDAAAEDGLTFDHHGTLYAFWRSACLHAFRAAPHLCGQSAHIAAPAPDSRLPVIDEGMRRWYDQA